MRYPMQPLRQQRQLQPLRHARQPRCLYRHRQSGFLLLDIVLGCSLLAIVFAAMLGGAHLYGKGQKKMDSRRAATRLAEAMMTDLQRGEKVLPAEGVKITQMDERIAVGTGDDGLVWCEVRATSNDIEVSLAGLVPRASINAITEVTPAKVNTSPQQQKVTP